METKVKRPENLEQFELIAIMGLRDTPKNPEDLADDSYNKSILAVNSVEEKIQVYVNAKNQKGLNDFKKAYPNAEIRADATLDEPEKWELLGFTRYMASEDETPLDVFYKAHHSELKDAVDRNKVKERRKNK